MRLRFTGWVGDPILDIEADHSWAQVFTFLQGAGFEVVDAPFGTTVDALVALNHSAAAVREADASRVPLNRRVLVLYESFPVRPDQYRSSVFRMYGRILTLSPSWASRITETNAESFMHPSRMASLLRPSFEDFSNRENNVSIVQANKHSAVNGEQYTLRRRVIQAVQRDGQGISVYGSGWNAPRITDWELSLRAASRAVKGGQVPNLGSFRALAQKINDYRGCVDDKQDAITRHRASVVIENSIDYLSEKPIDAIRNGSIALYVGPTMTYLGLPTDLVIPLEPTVKGVLGGVAKILTMSVHEQFEVLQRQQDALLRCKGLLEESIVLSDLAGRIADQLALT